MNQDFQQDFTRVRFPVVVEPQAKDLHPARFDRRSSGAKPAAAMQPSESPHRWLVDVTALSRCAAIFAGRGTSRELADADRRPSHQSLLEVPPAYDQFCRAHFASVKRLHPEMRWEDACPVYAIALSAHAALCVALGPDREPQLEKNWERLRGQSTLDWAAARPLIADGCSAMHRMDPLAILR